MEEMVEEGHEMKLIRTSQSERPNDKYCVFDEECFNRLHLLWIEVPLFWFGSILTWDVTMFDSELKGFWATTKYTRRAEAWCFCGPVVFWNHMSWAVNPIPTAIHCGNLKAENGLAGKYDSNFKVCIMKDNNSILII
ncbi:hypothetical protein V6N13_011541 [Hibiscus sabdariffa]